MPSANKLNRQVLPFRKSIPAPPGTNLKDFLSLTTPYPTVSEVKSNATSSGSKSRVSTAVTEIAANTSTTTTTDTVFTDQFNFSNLNDHASLAMRPPVYSNLTTTDANAIQFDTEFVDNGRNQNLPRLNGDEEGEGQQQNQQFEANNINDDDDSLFSSKHKTAIRQRPSDNHHTHSIAPPVPGSAPSIIAFDDDMMFDPSISQSISQRGMTPTVSLTLGPYGSLSQSLMSPGPSVSRGFDKGSSWGQPIYNDIVDVQSLQAEIHLLKSQLTSERTKGRSQKLVSGSQFRLPPKEGHSFCDNCDIMDRSLKKQKETVRSLRLCVARAEDQLHQLKKSKLAEDGHLHVHQGGMSMQQELDNALRVNQVLVKKIEEMEADIVRMRSSKRTTVTFQEMQAQLDEVRSNAQKELLDSRKENFTLTQTITRLNHDKDDSEAHMVRMKTTVSSFKQQIERAEQRYQDALTTIAAMEIADKGSKEALEVDRLNKELSKIMSFNTALTSRNDELTAALQQANHKIASLTNQLDVAAQNMTRKSDEVEAGNNIIYSLKIKVEDLERSCQKCELDLARSEERLAISRLENDGLRASSTASAQELERISHERDRYKHKVEGDAEHVRKSIETAISSSVRLCVVAPSVNVHVADKKLKFKSSLNEKALQQFITSEVLTNFTFLFKQDKEDSSPVRGMTVSVWIQQMLSDMQLSIEAHVNSALGD